MATSNEEKRDRNRKKQQRWADKHRAEKNERMRLFRSGVRKAVVRTPEERTALRKARQARYLKKQPPDYRYKRFYAWKTKNPGYWRTSYYKRYGIDLHIFERMIDDQDDRCAICREKFLKMPYVDHCHKTGKVRGLLCMKCNTGLGCFGDDSALLSNAMKYLCETRG